MRIKTFVVLTLLLKTNSADILTCGGSLGFSIPTMCRVSGGSVADDESLQISNANANITTLTFSNTNFTSIPKNIFVSFPKIKIFYVTNNNLNRLSSSSFQDSNQLTKLFFSTNDISTIPDQAFSLCTALTQLSIYDNPITTFTGNPFGGLNKLQQLTLEDLQIETFDSSVLQDLPALQILEMKNCSLTSIDADFLSSNVNITDINLNDNDIVTIEAGAFSNLVALNNLDVSYNMLTSLNTAYARTIIADNNKMKSLFIGSNAVSINAEFNLINNVSCDATSSVKFLYLTGNRISRIGFLTKMKSAVLVYLDSNRIRKFNKAVFANLKNVNKIELNDNPGMKLGSKMLASMTNVGTIRVDKFINGYKNLTQMFPNLKMLYLTTRNWSCTQLKSVANVLNEQKIYLYFNNATLDKANFKCQLNTWEVSKF
ncbi:decorin-like [Chironomus tepperi]|uniref:decorin-like n=1 Tax=Chironomus tepperi TaxID=113505 RepID=UPI00391F1CBC